MLLVYVAVLAFVGGAAMANGPVVASAKAAHPKCCQNEIYVPCKVGCPTNYCPVDDSRSTVACSPPHPCPPGCVCKGNYLRRSRKDERCILASTCPPVNCTRRNERWDRCPSVCLAERCVDAGTEPSPCDKPYSYCRPQCVCKQGFLRNKEDICIPAIQCLKSHPLASKCIPTCAVPNPPNCSYVDPETTNKNGRQCQEGYILSKVGGKCIKIEDCPRDLGCNGDPHARVKQHPLPCPSTCDAPDAVPCRKTCDPIGCECEPGYILSEINGNCILPDECEGGNPCGMNGTFAQCTSFGPFDYCPLDDSRDIEICDLYPFPPCYPGCICKQNYKWTSYEDDRCILTSECPAVECTRQNEEWNSCPDCLAEFCPDVDKRICCTNAYICEPQCICKENFFRNSSGVCIPADECPHALRCGLNEEPFKHEIRCPPDTCESIYTTYLCEGIKPTESGCKCINGYLRNSFGICVPSEQCPPPNPVPQCGPNEESFEDEIQCPPDTCESIYTTYLCEGTKPTESGCKCIGGYLRDPSGTCVPSEKCPPPNPDPQCGLNEEPFEDEIQCPPDTCESIYTTYLCEGINPTESGCKCINGYLRDPSGTCVPSEQCPPPSPCGVNGTLSECGFRCPNQYCPEDDSLLIVACKPGRPCSPGCMCKENYKRKSYEDDTCVLASDCPPVKCTRPNEVWKSCSQCLAERCEDINRPVLCADPPGTNCDPRCVCAEGYFRNKTDICVPATKCHPVECSRPN